MQKLTLNDILEAAHGTLVCGDENAEFYDITTDSRATAGGKLFIPLVGDNFDAHNFINAAFDMGAGAVLTHKDTEPMIGKTIIRVNDTRIALGDIARYYKKKYNVPTVSVTGSVGKTTTKDMLYAVVSQKYKTLKTPGNYNNDIGLPLTVFMLEKEHEAAVLEMGMNHFGEIDYLASIARPDIAVITNIGMSHIENLGSREGIFKAKTEVLKYLDSDKLLVVNGDDDYLSTLKGAEPCRAVYYGINNPENDVYAKDIDDRGIDGISFTAVADGREYPVTVNNAGVHNVYNALAAICVGKELGISVESASEGIFNCEYTAMRMAITEEKGMTIINDCYNASPDSIRAALSVLKSTEAERSVAILGDVLEMGDFAAKAHYELGESVVENNVDLLVTVGVNSAQIAKGAKDKGMENVVSFEKTLEAQRFCAGAVQKGDAVLIKASRGMHFEDIYNEITKAEE
ncbi:MAG: UDP-N-acetylmuramoyl-tripeptide--D-alanyl-D-alanine ligase [bacterium]|nr:UDP-N-acetylmuramoyl-tripeptide--D-alanyl-D-alanine ligase [bacterium]